MKNIEEIELLLAKAVESGDVNAIRKYQYLCCRKLYSNESGSRFSINKVKIEIENMDEDAACYHLENLMNRLSWKDNSLTNRFIDQIGDLMAELYVKPIKDDRVSVLNNRVVIELLIMMKEGLSLSEFKRIIEKYNCDGVPVLQGSDSEFAKALVKGFDFRVQEETLRKAMKEPVRLSKKFFKGISQ